MSVSLAKLRNEEIILDEASAMAMFNNVEALRHSGLQYDLDESPSKFPKLADSAAADSVDGETALNVLVKPVGVENSLLAKPYSHASSLDVDIRMKNLEAEEITLLSSIDDKTAQSLSNAATDAITHSDVFDIVEANKTKDVKFSQFWECLLEYTKKTKTVLVSGIAVWSSVEVCKWISNYIENNNGPRIVSKTPGKPRANVRIRKPYPCGFINKHGTANHPFDAEIQKITKGKICDDWEKYDPCGGWASLLPTSRLSIAADKSLRKKISLLTASNVQLVCRHISLGNAIAALCHEVGKTTGDILKESIQGIGEGLEINFRFEKCFIALFAALASVVILSSFDQLKDWRIICVFFVVILLTLLFLMKII